MRLGCTSFGGPIAHLGYFRTEFVERREWLSDEAFAELVALTQSMPGPASSQAGYALGLLRGGAWGACAAWLGFTLPSALLMLAFASGYAFFGGKIPEAILHGLQLVAVGVVAQAVRAMQKTLAPDGQRLTLVILATALVLFAPASFGIVLAIGFGVVAGILLLPSEESESGRAFPVRLPKKAGAIAAGSFVLLLLASLLLERDSVTGSAVYAKFYQAGALVFGGGHVVLPVLNDAVVRNGWISPHTFLSGYGAAQALPGPLFCFAAYLGAAVRPSAHPLLFGAIALCSIFLPGLLIMTAILPFWATLRERRVVRAALAGINASVVGVLIAALYQPVWTSTVHTASDFWIALAVFAMLTFSKTQPWMIVLAIGGLCGLVAALP